MNEILKAIKERRSIRKFTSEMPKKEDIEKIIEAGLYAPSGMGTQDVIIVAVTDKAVRDRLSAANRLVMGVTDESRDPFYGAPVVLVVLGDRNNGVHVKDGSLVMGNLLLATHALGLGGVWIDRAKEEFDQDEWKQFLKDIGVEGEGDGIGHCCIGCMDGANPEPAPRKPGRVYWVE